MEEKLLFVTGFQKSGTSLLNRTLMSQKFIENPFLPEGKLFWGDDPVDNPTSKPCGEIYQKYFTKKGYQLTESDFSFKHQQLLLNRIKDANIDSPVLMNKNPNLIVRLSWLKKIFPKCKVIVVLREPIPNLYSFSKKMHMQSEAVNNGLWWGVKPKNWENLLNSDSLIQIVSQWKAVFKYVIEHINCIDMAIKYSSFCQNPIKQMHRITSLLDIDPSQINLPFEELRCMDDEYMLGGSLESKNVLLRREKTFEISEQNLDDTSFKPFTNNEINYIKNETKNIWEELTKKLNQKLE